MPARPSRSLYLGIVLLSMVVFVAGTIAWIGRPRAEQGPTASTGAPPALAPAPFAVSLSVGVAAGHAALGSPVRAVAEAVGVVATIQLWDGGVQVGSLPVEGPIGSRAEFTWTPLRRGSHLLHARAVDRRGTTALSAPVGVTVFAPAARPSRLLVPAGSGATAASVAAQAGIAPAQVDPVVDGSGQRFFAVDPADVVAATKDTKAVVESPPPLPSTPALVAAVQGCTVQLTASGLDGPGQVFGASGTGSGFALVADLAGNGTTKLDDLGPGSHAFSLAPEGKPVTGAPVAMVLGDECKQSWWTGDATLVDGVLTLPDPAENVYFYLGVDDQPFTRVPAAEGQFLSSPTNHIDVSKHLPVLSGSTVRLEVWSGATPATKLGSGVAKLPAGASVASLIGESTHTVIATSTATIAPNADEVSFQWATGNGHASGVFWQVLSGWTSSDEDSLSPVGLIATGVAPVGEVPAGLVDGATKGGTFTLAPSVLLGAVKGSSGPGGGLPVVSSPTVNIEALRTAGVTLGAEPLAAGSGVPVILGDKVWVRVVPIGGGQPLGAASPTTALSKPVPTEPPTAVMAATSLNFDAGRAGNPALANCVRVTKVPWTSAQASQPPPLDLGAGGFGASAPASGQPDTSQWTFVAPFYPTPGTYCWNDFGHDTGSSESCGWDPFCHVGKAATATVDLAIEAVGPIWDFIAKSYNGLIDLAATLVAKLNPLCLSAKAAGAATGSSEATDVGSACETLSKVAAKAAIAAVLAMYGLPPSLPTSDQLAALAEGRMTDFAVEMMKELGVPCDDMVVSAEDAQKAKSAGIDAPAGGVDVCRTFAEKILSEIQAQATVQAQQTVASLTGLPGPAGPIAGFDMMLEPRQSYRGPTVAITAEPTDPATPPSAVCSVNASVVGYGAKPVDGFIGHWQFSTFEDAFDLPFGQDADPLPTTTEGWASVMRIPLATPPGQSHPLHAKVTSGDCLTPAAADLYATVNPPLGRWAPGQAE